jgi:outer membrane protein assembly factor BamB
VYLSSAYGLGPGGGVAMALNAATGKLLWSFNTVAGSDAGVKSIGLGSGGAWETPLVGSDGSVTFGTGNPYQSPASAMAHPSAQLYTDSDLNLDAATGKLRWYYQGVPACPRQGRRQAGGRGGGTEPGDRQDRMVNERTDVAARCRHGIGRPGLHHVVQRRPACT